MTLVWFRGVLNPVERRCRYRVRHAGLTGYRVFLPDHHPVEGRLIDISETGLQFAVEGMDRIQRVRGTTRKGWIHRGMRGIYDLLPFPEGMDSVPFHGHVLWTMHDHANDRAFAGVQFETPLKLPHSLLFLPYGDE